MHRLIHEALTNWPLACQVVHMYHLTQFTSQSYETGFIIPFLQMGNFEFSEGNFVRVIELQPGKASIWLLSTSTSIAETPALSTSFQSKKILQWCAQIYLVARFSRIKHIYLRVGCLCTRNSDSELLPLFHSLFYS